MGVLHAVEEDLSMVKVWLTPTGAPGHPSLHDLCTLSSLGWHMGFDNVVLRLPKKNWNVSFLHHLCVL